jgi:hypothetical protein
MPRRYYPRVVPSRYTPLIAYLAVQDVDQVRLTFTEIEAIIGTPLSLSAQLSGTMWTSDQQRLARDLADLGWRAHLRVRVHAVEFRRILPTT